MAYSNPTEWFTCADSYNPALHNISNALTFRLTYSFGPLPSIPTEITKYLDPPATVIERSETTLKRLRDVMDVKFGGSPLGSIRSGREGS